MDHSLPIGSAERKPSSGKLLHDDFCMSRQHLLADFRAWIASKPPHEDVWQELDGTINAMRQLLELGANDA